MENKRNIQDRLEGSNFTVIAEDENRVELSFTRAWNPSYQNSPPLNIDKRYVMLRGSPGFYTYATVERLEGMPGTTITQTRDTFKLSRKLSSRGRNWGLQVNAPIAFETSNDEDNAGNKVYGVWEEDEFDTGAAPPFKLSDVREAIPKHCFVKDAWRSMSYVVRDILVVFGLAATAAYFNNWFLWPIYWFAQGTMFWALFVLAHDCGHGSFSNNSKLNSVVGHLLHSSILVPYHGWRISHRTHHQNHGHVENDESWHPVPKRIFNLMDDTGKRFRFTLPFPLLAYPFYLWIRSPGKKGSHYDPNSDLFVPSERKDVITSTICWTTMASLLVGLCFVVGPIPMLKLYGIPYWIFVMWLDFVTYLHHHGHEGKLPWYRGKEWTYLRGGLTTLDRDYGWINNIHHDIGTHVVHHLFPQIPHYHLIEATEAARPVLGKYYREVEKSGPIPFHLLGILIRSLKQDHYDEYFLLTWDVCVRLATEVAGALYYLHSVASIPIYQRDIKSPNILLDDKYTAKVTDFRTSRSISIDQTHLTTRVQGQKRILATRLGIESRSLATLLLMAMEEYCVLDILDSRGKEEMMAFANIACRCFHLNGRNRPVMKQVVDELENIRNTHGSSAAQHYEEVEYIIKTRIMISWTEEESWTSSGDFTF
ncbi:hypothetical protein ACET3Z_028327 [Daucus carota]